MRITFILRSLGLNGGIRVVAIYAQHLRQRGHDVRILSFKNKKIVPLSRRIKTFVKNRLFSPGYSASGCMDAESQALYSHIPCDASYHQVIDHPPPLLAEDVPDGDIVIATWWETAEWVAQLPASKGAKVYLIQHHEVHDYLPYERVRATYQLPLRKITVSQWLLEIMCRDYGDPQTQCVPNSVDLNLFHARPRGKNLIPTVGMVYAQNYWKGCDISLQAVAIAREKIPNLRLVAFGAIAPIPGLPLPTHTHYVRTPSQSTLKDLYSQCDAWLFGSRTEGFGLPILEAMACRTPVIGTPAGAAPELLGEGAGILVPPEDPQAMADAIIALMHCPEAEWQALSDRAYTKASSYTWEDATDRFETALFKIFEAS